MTIKQGLKVKNANVLWVCVGVSELVVGRAWGR